MKARTLLSMSMIITAFLLMGCAGPAYHRRYTWNPATGSKCPASFRTDLASCFNVGYVPNMWGGGAAIVKTTIEDCMKKRGYLQVGGTASLSEASARPWTWQVSTWPWPESPPASPWFYVKTFSELQYVDAVCVAAPGGSPGVTTPEAASGRSPGVTTPEAAPGRSPGVTTPGPEWIAPDGVTEARLKQDRYECLKESASLRQQELYAACMEARGYRQRAQ